MNDRGTATRPPQVKCVVWDLDDTVWDGVLAEGDDVRLREGVADLIRELDARGVLQSVASKNQPSAAAAKLAELGLSDYFLFPQISWEAKSRLLERIAEQLNIGPDTLLFVDDSPFERAEVADRLPAVRSADPADLAALLDRADLPPKAASADATLRRTRYRDEVRRQAYEEDFTGPRKEFLRSLDMRLTVRDANPDDLDRAAELTERTHQLNTTGLTFSKAQLRQLMSQREHTVLVASLRDRFGAYGTIGLVLLTRQAGEWRIRLFLMSCRVMGRDIGGAVLAHLAAAADRQGVRLTADFRHTDVNRPMYLLYRLSGFAAEERAGRTLRLRLGPKASRCVPDHVTLEDP
ncbi:HAD-IIIC family phosphatase [Streptomyces varsoviensis]|uniref:HAD-IIIC family phosphatase n=1 Tax=Streptomyces varsoviensis TaxID=67373 RepID=UPI0033D1B9D3